MSAPRTRQARLLAESYGRGRWALPARGPRLGSLVRPRHPRLPCRRRHLPAPVLHEQIHLHELLQTLRQKEGRSRSCHQGRHCPSQATARSGPESGIGVHRHAARHSPALVRCGRLSPCGGGRRSPAPRARTSPESLRRSRDPPAPLFRERTRPGPRPTSAGPVSAARAPCGPASPLQAGQPRHSGRQWQSRRSRGSRRSASSPAHSARSATPPLHHSPCVNRGTHSGTESDRDN